MDEILKNILDRMEAYVPSNKNELESFKVQFLGKKGEITSLFGKMKDIPAEQRKDFGLHVNKLKEVAQQKIDFYSDKFDNELFEEKSKIDLSLPANFLHDGGRHPLSIVTNKIYEIFGRIGFSVSYGPEIEDDWHNFSALNFAKEHPARDMQDTFFVEKDPDIALRTHTSSIQVRIMESTKPPIRTICAGRVFRNETVTARSHCIFHQVEGLYIDKKVSFADLKQTLMYFAKEMFGEETKIRLRPSYFPFTEPSAEMDISCDICGGKGCNLCKYSGWVEILGCGMVDPNVLENCGIDSKVYSGFAFGMGIERMTQQLYKTKDIRMFFENDIRFLSQFNSFNA